MTPEVRATRAALALLAEHLRTGRPMADCFDVTVEERDPEVIAVGFANVARVFLAQLANLTGRDQVAIVDLMLAAPMPQ